ncbi:MAG: hypothetical protein ACOY46_11175 [Bacillota bacterium]
MSGIKTAESIISRLLLTFALIFLSLHVLSADRLSENQYDAVNTTGTAADISADTRVITLFLRDYSLLPHMRVLVNGDVRGEFKNRYVTVTVNSGDVVSIDGTYYNMPVRVELLNASKAVTSPRPGDIFNVKGNITTLGKVVTRL